MNANAPDFNAKAIDNTIDRALSALRDARPRSGSEMLAGRILASPEHRTAASQHLRPHFSVHLALWTATSAAVLAVASLIILHRPTTLTEFAHAPQAQLRPNTADSAPLQVPVIGSPRASTEPAPSTRRHPERSAAQRRTSVFEEAQPQQTDTSSTPSDAQLLADLHAPSHPAPPLPLTPQEKLFLRMLRYANSTELAELDPMVRAKQDADETTAFKAFFPDPPPLQQPNGDTE